MHKLIEIFWIFLKLGCSSFGGPVAHLVFFKQRFVEQKHWLTETQYSQIMALTQLLPGPSSSQMGIAIGYLRHGYAGAVMAWLGFTLPSVMIMIGLAILLQKELLHLNQHFFHHISIIVLAIICFAFWQMLRTYCKTAWQYLLMFTSAVLLINVHYPSTHFLIILSIITLTLIYQSSQFQTLRLKRIYLKARHLKVKNTLQKKATITFQQDNTLANDFFYSQHQQKHAYLWFLFFATLYLTLFLVQYFWPNALTSSLFKFYSSSALVFGGGHVVLPILQQDFVNSQMIPQSIFDLGYTLAQFMPGPLFSFASYLGTFLPITASVVINGLIATICIFSTSFFLVFASLPYWSKLLGNHRIQNIVNAINTTVVGFLLAIIIPSTQTSILNILDILCLILMFFSLYKKISIFLSVPILLTLFYLLNAFLSF